jgi:hypothetical protein
MSAMFAFGSIQKGMRQFRKLPADLRRAIRQAREQCFLCACGKVPMVFTLRSDSHSLRSGFGCDDCEYHCHTPVSVVRKIDLDNCSKSDALKIVTNFQHQTNIWNAHFLSTHESREIDAVLSAPQAIAAPARKGGRL